MNDTKKAQTRTSRSVWIVAATLLLLTGAVWLVAWLSSHCLENYTYTQRAKTLLDVIKQVHEKSPRP